MPDYINTYSKVRFYPLEPRIEDVHIADIAHALSYMTRANGHLSHFFSVAQHSINCMLEARARGWSERVQLACLLHDASEAYLSDITRPVKHNLPDYLGIEQRLQDTIFARFGIGDLSVEERVYVNDIDDAMLYYEFAVIEDVILFDIQPTLYDKPDFSERPFLAVKEEFLEYFGWLTREE